MAAVKVKGLETVMNNLNRELDKIKGRSVEGLMAGGLIIQAEAQKRVPVEYGNLRASAYTRRAQNDPLAVEVGFSASYAGYVHENLAAKWKGQPRASGKGVYWGPTGQPRFLSAAVEETKDRVLIAVKTRAEIKK